MCERPLPSPEMDLLTPSRPDWRAVLAERRPPRRTDAAHRLVLLGTAGGSNPKATRAGYSNAIVVGDAAYIVDCGEGAHRQLWRAGLTLNPGLGPERPVVRAMFVTHLHADHVMDLANLLLGSWPPHVDRRVRPRPGGTADPGVPARRRAPPGVPRRADAGHAGPVDQMLRAFAYNINLRIADEGRNGVSNRCGSTRSAWLGTDMRPTSISAAWPTARAGVGRARHGARRRLSRGRPRGDGERDPRAARAGVPRLRLPIRHPRRLGGVLGRHRRVRERRPAGAGAPTSWSTR